MSHFTTIKTQIKDVEALRGACQEMGLAVLEKSNARGFAGSTQGGDYVIKLKGPYDIALKKEENGSFGLSTDWWDGHVEREVGQNFGKLLQLYAVHKATTEARRKGLAVLRRAKRDGSIKLILMGAL